MNRRARVSCQRRPGARFPRLFVLGALASLLLPGLAIAAPDGLRLSFTGDTATTMTVSWNTAAQTATEVRYGTQMGVYTDTATGTSFQGAGPLGWIHEATLTGLEPDTRYYYVAGNAADGWSQEASFTTGPVEDQDCGTFNFVMLGDNRPDPTFGGGENWPQILAQAMNHQISFSLNGGDLVIDGDQLDEWVDFLGWTEAAASHVPLMPCLGNHDTGPGEGDTANYNQIFALPRSSGTHGSGTEDYYYFTFGNAIFVALSTESFEGGAIPFQTQASYLDEVLTANPKKWKFVWYHKPSYTHEAYFSISHEPNEDGQNAALMPVIDAHHVDVVFTSHNHWYERFHPSACATAGSPGSDSACSVGANNFADGTVYYVTGGAGAFTIPGMLCGSESGRANCSGDHHYILVSIQNNVATLETWAAYPQTNQPIDSITITKPFVTCDEPPGPDAGVPDAGPMADAGAPDSGPLPDAAPMVDARPRLDSGPGSDASVSPDSPKQGCSCQASPSELPSPLPLVLLGGLGLLAIRRRRRRRSM